MIEPITSLAFKRENLATNLAELRANGLGVIKAEEFALLTLSSLPRATLLEEGCIYNAIPEAVLIVNGRYNPVLRNPEAAMAASRRRIGSPLDDKLLAEVVELARTNPLEAIATGVLCVPYSSIQPMLPASAIPSTPMTLFLFREHADAYGQALSKRGKMFVSHFDRPEKTRMQNAPYARAIKMGSYSLPNVLDASWGVQLHHANTPIIGVQHASQK